MKNANEQYAHFYGSNSWNLHWFGLVYSEGVKALCDDCTAYWLLDLIASYQTESIFKEEGFQVWRMIRLEKETFQITVSNGNGKILIKKEIEGIDFLYDALTLWCIESSVILPSEY